VTKITKFTNLDEEEEEETPPAKTTTPLPVKRPSVLLADDVTELLLHY
jgi:hypothetical protein